MYSWADDTSDWYRPGSYLYDPGAKSKRDAEAARAEAAGPRSYAHRSEPNFKIVDPAKRVRSESQNPLVVAVDVTGSMSTWPYEIFDRLPLLYNTLAQYRPDLEVLFAAIGDAGVDRYPLQVTSFASGFDLEQQLKALYGEGGGGDAPESYGLFAYWVRHHVEVPNAKRPFLIVFGDITMHERIPAKQVRDLTGDDAQGELKAIDEWQALTKSWSCWFLRRPGGSKNDEVHRQWTKALGEHKCVSMQNEQRAVDYAMGIIARTWGHFDDFRKNMAARQDESQIDRLEKDLDEVKVRALACPKCAAPVPAAARGRAICEYCAATLHV